MANKRIDELTEKTTMVDADLIPIYDSEEAGSEKTKKITRANLKSYIDTGDIIARDIYSDIVEEESILLVDTSESPVGGFRFHGNLDGGVIGSLIGDVDGNVSGWHTWSTQTFSSSGSWGASVKEYAELDGSSAAVVGTDFQPSLRRLYVLKATDVSNTCSVQLSGGRTFNLAGNNKVTFNVANSYISFFCSETVNDAVMCVLASDGVTLSTV
jgi:hypothetical protein